MIEIVADARPELALELAFPCSICCARVGQRCHSLINAAHVMPMSHYRRRALAQAATVKEPHA